MDMTVYTDSLEVFQIEGQSFGADLRGRMVRIGPALKQALEGHNYPPVVARLLGETVAVSLMLASSLKYDGVFVLQTKSEGPIKTLMADVTSAGDFRCYANFDQEQLDAVLEGEEEPTLMRLLGPGYLAFSVDQGPDTERYQGLTELTGTSLADCAHQYFSQSDQLKTAMVVMAEERGQIAGALMIQQLPHDAKHHDEQESVEEDWHRAIALMSSVTARELLDDGLPPAELLYRLFNQDGVRMFESRTLCNKCRCSQAKVSGALISFSEEEREGLFEDDKISVVCEFCQTGYSFSRDDVAKLV